MNWTNDSGTALAPEPGQDEAELSAIYEHAPTMMLLVDPEGRLQRCNRAALEFVGRDKSEAASLQPGDFIGCLHSLHNPEGCGHGPNCTACILRQTIQDTLSTGQTHRRVEVKPAQVRGELAKDVIMLASTARVTLGGQPMALVCLEDVTTQRRLEEQLRQSQKMDAIGQMAGGVAHDFNNILTGILAHLGLLQGNPRLDREMRESLAEMENETKRASNLTRQLLLFSRRQVMQVKPVDLNGLLENMLNMLRRLLGENITVEFKTRDNMPWVKADPNMLEQVVLNLCVNARDAMPRGGRLTLATDIVDITVADVARRPEARVGQFVRFSVTDTGKGMDAATLSRIFEPFFTTKEVGKGTGLGLATVFGIVKQHEGWIETRSVVGQGSRFTIYVPSCAPSVAQPDQPARSEAAKGGTETILLVEDEKSVRQLTALLLRRKGYRVLEAANGVEALRQWEQFQNHIDLLFSDMIMPEGLSGLDLVDRFRAEKPNLRVILCSGYSTELVGPTDGLGSNIVSLPKPWQAELMAKTVRDSLDRGREIRN